MLADLTTPTSQTAVPFARDVESRHRAVVREVVLEQEEPVCAVLDLDTLDELVAALFAAYAEVDALHTIADKAIALRLILQHLADAGLGCEVASPGEPHLALAAGFAPDRIVYGSPAKTDCDLAEALRLCVTFNVDNFEEVARVDRLVACFAGDLIATGRRLLVIHAGDIIAVPDTGGYYVSNHFGYNSLLRPAVYAARHVDGISALRICRRKQTIRGGVTETGEVELLDLSSTDRRRDDAH